MSKPSEIDILSFYRKFAESPQKDAFSRMMLLAQINDPILDFVYENDYGFMDRHARITDTCITPCFYSEEVFRIRNWNFKIISSVAKSSFEFDEIVDFWID